MARYFALLLVFCGLALVAVFQLRSSPAERIEAQLAELAPEEALERLNRYAARAKLGPNLALAHVELALDLGEFETARAALEHLRSHPGMEVFVELRLAEVARLSGDLDGAITHLAAAHALEPTEERRLALGGWYRARRAYDDEMRLLQSVPPAELTEWEAGRLIDLLGRAGQAAEVEKLLRSLAMVEGTRSHPHLLGLLDLLVASGRDDEAAETAWWWHVSRHDTDGLEGTVRHLLATEAAAPASRLADRAVARYPELLYRMVPLLARNGRWGAARDLAFRWLETGEALDDDAWRMLIDLASVTGDVAALRIALARIEPGGLDDAVLEDALGQFLRYRGARSLAEHRRLLTPAFLDASPLTSAAWAVAQGRRDDVLSELLRAAEGEVAGWRQAVWLQLAGSLRGTAWYPALFQRLPPDSELALALAGRIVPTPDVIEPR